MKEHEPHPSKLVLRAFPPEKGRAGKELSSEDVKGEQSPLSILLPPFEAGGSRPFQWPLEYI